MLDWSWIRFFWTAYVGVLVLWLLMLRAAVIEQCGLNGSGLRTPLDSPVRQALLSGTPVVEQDPVLLRAAPNKIPIWPARQHVDLTGNHSLKLGFLILSIIKESVEVARRPIRQGDIDDAIRPIDVFGTAADQPDSPHTQLGDCPFLT